MGTPLRPIQIVAPNASKFSAYTKDPVSLISLGIDGNEKKVITPKTFNVRVWEVNEISGTLVVGGFYDSNRNGRYDPQEKNEIHIYDLKTYKLIYKINE